jgi:chromosome segregation ATPase
MQGYNATVLAYGQTASGKTFTMGTGQANADCGDDDGIAPKVIRNSFVHMESQCEEMEFKTSCSYIEIYNEDIRDLLQPDTPKHAISIRETPDSVIQVAGIHAETCNSAAEMLRCLADGTTQRTTAATLMNEQSSRSHSIFTIILEQRRRSNKPIQGRPKGFQAWHVESGGEASNAQLSYRTAKFHLVDLAGSERAKRTGAVGSRFKESVAINSGLLALGNVISALGDPGKRGSHVPYRESKLTRLLQDSLGGNSRTWMIACASCADCDFEETANTLKYAHRARNIKNKPVVNHDPRVAQLAAMQDEIQALRDELRRVSTGVPLSSTSQPGDAEMLSELNEKLEASEKRHVEVVERLVTAESETEALQRALLELYSSICQQLPVLAPSTPRGTTDSEARQVAVAALCKVLHNAKSALAPQGSEVDQVLPEVPSIPGVEMSLPLQDAQAHLASEGAAVDDLKGSMENSESCAAGETARLESLAAMRKDAAPLLRKYLDEIQRLESDVVMYRRRSQQLAKELQQAQDDLHNDEEIFEEKMREMKDLADRNEQLVEALEKQARERTSAAEPAPLKNGFGSNDSRSLAARLEDSDEVRTEEPDVSRPGSAGGLCHGAPSGILEDHVDGAVQAELQDSLNAQRSLEQEMQQLTQNVSLKEELISELVRSESEWSVTKAQYQKLIEQLQNDLEQMQRECALVQSQERSSLERCIAEQTETIKRKQQEFSRLRELRHQDSRRIRELEAEMSSIKGQQRECEHKLQSEQKRASRLEEVVSKMEDIKVQQINDLQSRLSSMEDLKVPQVNDLQHRLQREPSHTEQKSRGSTPLRASHHSSAPSLAAISGAAPSSSRAGRLEHQIDEQLKKHELSQSVEEDIRKCDALIKKREQYLSYRRKIAAKDSLEQAELYERLRQLEGQLAQLDREIVASAGTGGSDEAESRRRSQREAVAAEYSKLSETGQQKHSEGQNVLNDVDERLECLRDEIDFREARIAKAQQMLQPSPSGASNPAVVKPVSSSPLGELDAEVASLPPEDAKELLIRYCEKLVRQRQREKQTGKRLNAVQAQLEERSKHVTELKEVLRKQDANSTKALAKVTKEYEGRIRILLRQLSAAQQNASQEQPEPSELAASASRGNTSLPAASSTDTESNAGGTENNETQQLRRDNQYFKAVNRELKRRLRNLLERAEGTGGGGEKHGDRATSSDAGGKQQHVDLSAKVRRLEKEKEALREENTRVVSQIQTLKQHYTRFHEIQDAASGGQSPNPAQSPSNR